MRERENASGLSSSIKHRTMWLDGRHSLSALPFLAEKFLYSNVRRLQKFISRPFDLRVNLQMPAIRHRIRLPFFCSSSLSSTSHDRATVDGRDERASHGKSNSPVWSGDVGEEKLLIGEVLVKNKDGEDMERKDLEAEALEALKSCKANSALTIREVQEDVHRIISSGYFTSCVPVAMDTRDGIQLVFQVEPNQDFHGLICEGASVLPSYFLEDAFRGARGKIINIKHLHGVINSINSWYMERGIFGLVSDCEILSGGVLKLQVSEAEVDNILIRFLDRKSGEPTVGKTKAETILRRLTIRKGQVYNLLQGKRDVETILSMDIMEDVSLVPQPSGDVGKVDLMMNCVERVTGGFSAGGGVSSGIRSGPLSGLIGSFAYSHRNVFGKNQKLNLSVERGQIDSIFRVNYTDPWIEGDDNCTSRSLMIQNSKTPGTLVYGSRAGQGALTICRVTTALEYSRPLRPKWSGTAGITFQHAGARGENGELIIRDFFGGPLTSSGNAYDNMLLMKLESAYTDAGDRASSGFVFSVEQGLPFLPEWLCFNRVTVRARTGVELGPAHMLLTFSGGHVVGSFPPHEAFPIGGTNSVRGYEEGAVGSGRSYMVGSGEISFRMFGRVCGAIFADCGSDLGSGSSVPGDPAGARGKPGSGYGYGAGIRVDSPFGPLRLEYAFNDKHDRRFHFGVGLRS